ncbi:hypothetical protein N2152v2_005170 [Parachlorella kessleri]
MALSSKAQISQGFRQAASPARLAARPVLLKSAVAFRDDDRQTKNKPYKISSDPNANTLQPAFTRRRERIVSRLAMAGVAFTWAGEVITGLGPMHQLSQELNVPLGWAYLATAGLAVWQLGLALAPGSATYSDANQRDVKKRRRGVTGITEIEPDVDSKISIADDPGKWFLRQEVVLGRLAMLIFAGAMGAEFLWNGEAPLAHLGLITPGVPLTQAPLWLLAGIGLFGAGALGVFSAGGTRKDDDTF